MISRPTCALSHANASSFCYTEGCTLPAFSCQTCDNQYCLSRHKHTTLKIGFWEELATRIRSLDEHYRSSLSDQQQLKIRKLEITTLIDRLQRMLEDHERAISELRAQFRLVGSLDRVYQCFRNNCLEQLTGGDLHHIMEKLPDVRHNSNIELIEYQLRTESNLCEKVTKAAMSMADYYEQERLDLRMVFQKIEEGEKLRRQGRFSQAVQCYQKVLKVDGRNAELYHRLAMCYFELKQYKQVILAEDEAVKLRSDHPAYFDYRAMSYYLINEHRNAVIDYTSAIELNPGEGKYYLNRAATYLELKKYQPALEDSNEAIRLNPHNDRSFLNRGVARFRLKINDEAISDFTSAIRLNPTRAASYNYRGKCYEQTGDDKLALREFQQASNMEPGNFSYKRNVENAKLRIKGTSRLEVYERRSQLLNDSILSQQAQLT